MESQKKLLFESMRCNPDRRPSLKAAMTEFEAKARKCYSTEFNNIDTDAFAEMMLTDAFFIIHTFISFDRWCKNPDDPEVQGEPIFKTPWTQGNICEDLLMLENQLPFFILVQVYAILTNESANCLKKLAMQFFEQVELGRGGCGGDDSEKVADNPKHLLDLFHSSFVVVVDKSKMQKPTKIKDDKSKMQKPKIKTKYWVSNASALRSNGVSFIGTNKGNPLDIQFNHGIGRLRVPTLCINDRTATVLKNLVAYEQGSRLPNPYFTCLAIFFSNIALNADDIKLLRKADIINHQPADDEAIVLLLQQLNKASQNGFKDCLIKHHLQLIERYLLSGRARVMSFVRQKGGVENLLFHLSMFFCFTLLFDLIGYGLGVR
nr:UPF0481 protein At3g47200-like [Ipomoea batatas]